MAKPEVRDYGTRRVSKVQRALRLAWPPMLALAGGWVLLDWADRWTAHQASAKARAAEWTVEGPPCPAAAPGPSTSRYLMTFHEVEFGRRFGHAECRFISGPAGRGPVCQFTSPDSLEVRTARGSWRYTPGIGRPATILVLGEAEPRCVMATTFELARRRVGKVDP